MVGRDVQGEEQLLVEDSEPKRSLGKEGGLRARVTAC